MTQPIDSPRDPKAQAKADKAYRKAQRPFYQKKRFILPAAFVALILLLMATNNSGSKKTTALAAPVASQSAAPAPAATTPPARPTPPVATKTATATANAGYSDVAITSCTTGAAGYASAKVKVTNTSSKASNYMVTVTFESPDGSVQIGTGMTYVSHLQPGQVAEDDANSLKEPGQPFVCKINPRDVTRYAA